MSKVVVGFATLACTLFATSAFAQTEQRELKGARIAVYNLAGRVRAIAGTGDAVVVEVTRSGADASKLKIETGPIRGRETLRIVYPSDVVVYPDLRARRTNVNVRDDGTFSDGTWEELRSRDRVDIRSYGSGLEAHADLVIRVPRGQQLELFLAAGHADVTNVEGNLTLDVGSVEVDVAGTKGSLTLDTGSGPVAVRDATGDLNIDTGSGGLSLDRIKGGVLHLDSGSGGVQGTDVDVREFVADIGSGGLRMYRMKAPQVHVETGSGGALLELLSDIERLNVETGSGGVTVRAPSTLSADVDIETGSGGFQTDFQITTRRVSRNHVEGRIGDGRAHVRIEAGSGTVRLVKN